VSAAGILLERFVRFQNTREYWTERVLFLRKNAISLFFFSFRSNEKKSLETLNFRGKFCLSEETLKCRQFEELIVICRPLWTSIIVMRRRDTILFFLCNTCNIRMSQSKNLTNEKEKIKSILAKELQTLQSPFPPKFKKYFWFSNFYYQNVWIRNINTFLMLKDVGGQL